jgi:hypothetical protein
VRTGREEDGEMTRTRHEVNRGMARSRREADGEASSQGLVGRERHVAYYYNDIYIDTKKTLSILGRPKAKARARHQKGRRISFLPGSLVKPMRYGPGRLLPFLRAAHDFFHGFSRGLAVVEDGVNLCGDGEFNLVLARQR